MFEKGPILLYTRLLGCLAAVSIATACSGSGTSSSLPPQVSSQGPSQIGPAASNKTPGGTSATASPTSSFGVVQTARAGGTYNSTVTVQLAKAPVAGDVLVLFFEQNKGASFPYSGQVAWPAISSGSQWSYDGKTTYTATLHHVVQSGETGTYTLNVGGTGSGHEDYMVAEISGASPTNPLNARLANPEAAGTTQFNFGSNGITPTAAGTLPVAFFSAHSCCNGLSWKGISSGWTVQATNGEYVEEIATGPVQTGTPALNATATLSSGGPYPGASDVVLLNPAASAVKPSPSPTPTATPATTPTPAPTAAPTATPIPSGSSPYTFNGVPIWAANDWYTTNLITGGSSYAANSVDPNSANILSNFANAFPGLTFNINGTTASVTRGTPINTFTGSITHYAVSGCSYGCINDPFNDDPSPWSMPWQSSFRESGNCTMGDCHDIAFNTATGMEWETYNYGSLSFSGSSFSAEFGAVHDVSRSLNSQLTGGPDAAGLPVIGAMIPGEDASQPSINHILAISIAGSDNGSKASGGHVAPATAGNGCSYNCAYRLPFGARLRLNPARYTCPNATSYPQAHKLCVTMETYGVIVLDHNGTGSSYGPGLGPKADGTNPWNETDVQQLNGIPITAFDVMTLGTIH